MGNFLNACYVDARTGAPLGEKMFKTEDYGKFLQKNIHDEEIIGIFQATEAMSMTPQIYFIGVTDKNLHFMDSNKNISKVSWEDIFEIKVKGKMLGLQTLVFCYKNGEMKKILANTKGKGFLLTQEMLEYLKSRNNNTITPEIKKKQLKHRILAFICILLSLLAFAFAITVRKHLTGY
ncbi:MAG: hypothetical protein K6F69_03200 [Treponema sp.]|nr:hypothetical protein [Treponema sp.]